MAVALGKSCCIQCGWTCVVCMMQKLVLIYRWPQNWCLLELWLPHGACEWGAAKAPGWGGETWSSRHVGRTELSFITDFSSMHKARFLALLLKQEPTPLDIKPVDVLSHFQERRLRAESGLSSAATGQPGSCVRAPYCTRACVCMCQVWKDWRFAFKIDSLYATSDVSLKEKLILIICLNCYSTSREKNPTPVHVSGRKKKISGSVLEVVILDWSLYECNFCWESSLIAM